MATVLGREEIVQLGLPAFDSVERLDRRARETFSKVPLDLPLDTDPFQILQGSVRALDQWRALAGIAEAVSASGARTFGEVFEQFDDIINRAQLLTRIDPLAVFLSDDKIVAAAKRAQHQPKPDENFPLAVTPVFVRAVSSLLEFCPIEELVVLGEQLGHPDLGHRCRLSFDWLRAFVRRQTPGEQETLHILGRAYAERRLTLDDAAHLLSMPRTDAVAWLEEYGYARDLDAGALTPDERSARYARMRQDRVARKGEPAFDQQLVTRDVIASQRIEGVDARLWLQPGV
ncbi:MAG TPA: hypothetical protein VF584_13970 [Longimicrobium sp.]|jgi:hypothetical protein